MATTNRARAMGGLLPGPPGAPVVAPFPPSGATISVGRDSWVGEVMHNVVGLEQETAVIEQTNAGVVSDIIKPPQPVIRNDVRGKGDHGTSSGGVKCLADKIREKKRLFHSNRSLELKNLPDGVTEQDIRAAFPDLSLTNIIVERNDGRYRAGAKLQLAQPELLDDWPKSRENVFVKNKEVSVCVGSSDQWVCVARLPLDLTEEQFLSLVAAYGKVRAAFLMVSERSGTSKGYGLVKYYSNEAAAQARHLLDGREIRGFDIQADWLNSTHISFRSLHSKCLYVDHLPQNYRDMTGYRNIFSIITKPPYCQIALRNGVIQDWGLVEFFDSGEAELTQEKLNGHSLAPGNRIRVHYCIPGVNAINIYMKVVNAPADTKKKALLEDTPSSSVYSQLQKLASQNPVFAQNLQNIIQTQIQTIQTGVSPDDTRGSTIAPTSLPSEISPPQSNQNTQQQQQQQIDSNAQAALMILLTAQRQAQTGEASLLHNPEVVNVLQSLVCQEQAEIVQDPYAQIMNIPGMTVALGQHPNQHAGIGTTGLGNWPSQPSKDRQQIQPNTQIISTSSAGPTSKSPPPIIANNLNLLSNTQSLSQLLGVISHPETEKTPPPQPPPQSSTSLSTTSVPPMTQTSSFSAVNMRHSAPQTRPSLLGDRPPIPSTGQPPRPPQPSVHAQQMQMLQAQQAGQQQLLQAQLQAASQMQLGQQLASAHYYANLYPGIQQQQAGGYLLSSMPGLHVTGPPQVGPFLVPQAVPQQLGPMQLQQQSQILNSMGIQQQSLLASHPLTIPENNSAYTTSSFTIIPPITSPIGSPVPRVPSPGSSTSFLSPTGSIGGGGLKRKASIPPSPEQSPQGPYIGQHSQGLGGHYADSYWQKKRLKQN